MFNTLFYKRIDPKTPILNWHVCLPWPYLSNCPSVSRRFCLTWPGGRENKTANSYQSLDREENYRLKHCVFQFAHKCISEKLKINTILDIFKAELFRITIFTLHLVSMVWKNYKKEWGRKLPRVEITRNTLEIAIALF